MTSVLARSLRLVEPVTRDRDWTSYAACAGGDTEAFYPDPNILLVPEEVRAICEACTVRARCLIEALAYREEGIWGGTTERQREGLRRGYRRASCPSCGPSMLVRFETGQGCLFCGLSWLAVKARNSAGLVPVA